MKTKKLTAKKLWGDNRSKSTNEVGIVSVPKTIQQILHLRASFAGELFRKGQITRTECFRIEMDACLGRDSGPVVFEENTEYQELLRVGWTPKRT